MSASVFQVLTADGGVAGAGFLIGEDAAFTCAHVVSAAGQAPGGRVEVVFPNLPDAPRVWGRVPAEQWRAPEAEDVAVLRLESVPAKARRMALGPGAGCRGHRVSSFGFPVQAPRGGHFGYGKAGDLLPAGGGAGRLLQLSEANDLATGFSGGPVVDEVTGLVIGMVTAITSPDTHLKGLGIAYATPTEVLRKIRPELAEHQMCPYLGLEPFTAQHGDWFHGREAAVESVLVALGAGRRMLMLLGPSGSGKTSLVKAGVLPALAEGSIPGSDRWFPVLARPGHDLLAELERAGLPGATTDGIVTAVEHRLAAAPDHDRLLLVIDQFEELLTQPDSTTDGRASDQRLAAADQLVELNGSHAAVTVVLIMRNDFYAPLDALAPELMNAALSGLLNVPATLSVPELKAIITRPAEAVGLHIEAGLTERITTDVMDADPTVRQAPVTLLPPLELALRQLWVRRDDGRLTHAAYEKIGKVSGSMTAWCNTAINQLPADQRPIAQRILTALVRPADEANGIPATRQTVTLTRLRALAGDPKLISDAAFDAVLAALTRYRIITTGTTTQLGEAPGEPTAELIHDALIRDWSDLRDWVAQDHQFQLWLHRAAEQQARHARSGLPGDLLDGSLLAEGQDWVGRRPLPADITAILKASQQHQQKAIRRSRRINSILGVLLALALIATGIAFYQQHTATVAQRQALSRQLAGQSTSLLNTDADLASLLAIQAYRTSHTAEATASLEEAADFPLQDSFTAHAPVHSVAFNPKDSHILAISSDKSVQLQNVTTGKTLHTLTFTGLLHSMAFNRDGRILAIDSDKSVQLRNLTTGKTLHTLAVGEDVHSVAFSPDSKTLATGDVDGGIRLWDVATGRPLRGLNPNVGTVNSVVFSPDGRTLAIGAADSGVRLWDMATRKLRKDFPADGEVDSLAFSPDGRTLAGNGDGTVGSHTRLWDATTGQIKATLPPTDLAEVAFSPNGRTLATSGNTGVQLWDAATGQAQTTLATGSSVAFSPNGHTLATGNDNSSGTVQLWDATAGQARTTLPHTSGGTMVFSPDGRTLATADFISQVPVRLWDVATGKLRPSLTVPNIPDDLVGDPVAFGPNGQIIATGSTFNLGRNSDDNKVRLWDAATGALRDTLVPDPLPPGTHLQDSLVFSPDGRTLATFGGKSLQLWDLATHTPRNLPGTAGVNSVVFNPKDGRTLATVNDKGVQLWDLATHTPRNLPGTGAGTAGVNSAVFSPDGRTLATAGGNGVQLWDLTTHKPRRLPGTSPSFDLEFSPDGRTLATLPPDSPTRTKTSINNGVQLWDTATGQARSLPGTSAVSRVAFNPKDSRTLTTVGGEGGEGVQLWDTTTDHVRTTLLDTRSVDQVVFSPDGRTLAANDTDGPVRLWNASLPNPREAIQKICKAVHHDLTPQEWSRYLPGQSPSPICTS